MGVIAGIIIFMLGGTTGVTLMCLIQINRDNSKDKIKEKIENLSISLNDIENSLGMTANKYDTIKELNIKIDVLKELLEE